jgi:hypothetical protein
MYGPKERQNVNTGGCKELTVVAVKGKNKSRVIRNLRRLLNENDV